MLQKFHRLLPLAQGVIGLRGNDIMLVSYPKSGNTWVRFFLCNIISIAEWDSKTVNFAVVDQTMPEFGINNLLQPWPHKMIPRFVKTHRIRWPIFRGKQAIYIIRDPRDTMVSFYRYEQAKQQPRYQGDFSGFIRHPRLGLRAWLAHIHAWCPHSQVFTYEALRTDDVAVFQRMLQSVGVELDQELIQEAARRAKFDQVRSAETKYGLDKPGRFKQGYQFTRQGTSGGWKDYFSPEDEAYFAKLRTQYNNPLDLSQWGYE